MTEDDRWVAPLTEVDQWVWSSNSKLILKTKKQKKAASV